MHVETSKNEVGDLMVSWEKSNTMSLVHPRTLVKSGGNTRESGDTIGCGAT